MIGTCSSDDVTVELEWDKANKHNPTRVEAVVSPAEDENNDENCDEVLSIINDTDGWAGYRVYYKRCYQHYDQDKHNGISNHINIIV